MSKRGVTLPGILAAVIVFVCAGLIPLLTWWADSLETQGRRALIDGITLSFSALELKFAAADFNGWQTGYALDFRRGIPDALSADAPSRKAFLSSARSFANQLANLEKLPLDSEQLRHLEDARHAFDEFMSIDQRVMADYRGRQPAAMTEADRLVMEDEIRLFQSIAGDVEAIASSVTMGVMRGAGEAESGGQKARLLMTVASVIAIGLAVTVSFLLRRWVVTTRDLVAQLEVLAGTDQLTGVPNRRAWNERLRLLQVHALRFNQPITLAILDLDGFKAYNDTHGHLAGDAMLQTIAQRMQALVRTGDVFARFGGEEFVVALNNCSLAAGQAKVDQMRRSVPAGQTCSAGLTALLGDEDINVALARADRALYEAKSGGRDRLVVIDPLGGGTAAVAGA